MHIAVIGSGIAGLASSWLLSREHQVTLFEAGDYFGGHTHTHEVEQQGQTYRIDSGFIVHNPHTYPLLTRMFRELRVNSQPTCMSFSVQSEASGLEYNATSINTLFCQRRNLCSPRFLGLVRDLLRFYREAPALLRDPGSHPTLGEYLAQHRYGAAFRDQHLIPMASALWSSPAAQILAFPARYLIQFLAHHQMLQIDGPPGWCVVQHGSASYVRALRSQWRVTERLRCPVQSIRRLPRAVEIRSAAGTEQFDQVVLACHSDQALALLADADEREHAVLGAIPYQANDTVLHTDRRLLPRHPKAWAAWNAFLPGDRTQACTVSYCMNLLQGIESPEPFIVTLNRTEAIDPAKILARMCYHHPVYSHASMRARESKAAIQGRHNTWFAGAYWGLGFHEDGMRSAAEVAAALGVKWAEPDRLLKTSTAAAAPGHVPLPGLAA